MRSRNFSNIFRTILSLVILSAAVWVFFNRTYIVDQITVWRYPPGPSVSSLAIHSGMNDRGTFLFYASRPQIETRESFNTHCKRRAEKTAILGCYDGRQIFIYDIKDARLDGIQEVTAAHEMLHAAYERMSDTKKHHVAGMIDTAMAEVQNESLIARLKVYDKTEPGERYNELHSMLGSEAGKLPAELSRYYDQYFSDRQAVVKKFKAYEQVFAGLEMKQKDLSSQLNDLAAAINERAKAYSLSFDILQRDILAFNDRANSGNYTSQSVFNAERNRLLAQQRDLNDERTAIKAMIAQYDAKRKEYDDISLQVESLNRSIDSMALPEVPSL